MTRRVLMASWLFPPHGSIGAKRAYRFARHLPDCGWLPTVVCRRRVPVSARDDSPWPLPASVRVLATYDHPLWMHLEDLVSPPVAPAAPVAVPRGLSTGWRARAQAGWQRAVDAVVPTETVALHARNLYRVLDTQAAAHDVLWTTSYPYHAHPVASRVARRRGIPWVADLRDPWTPNWVHRQKLAPTRAVERWLERHTVETADAVVVTTEALASLYRDMFPRQRDKFVAIHNAYDPDGASPADGVGRPRRVVHFGNVYGPWSLATVLRALAALRAAGAPGVQDVVLENYGKLCDRDRQLAMDLGLSSVVQVLPAVPYAAGMARLRAADVLVLAAWDDPDARLYIQGKLYDYLLAGRPVLAETDNPEVKSMVEGTGSGWVVAPGDVQGAARWLGRALAGDATSLVRRADAVAYYGAPAATRRLAAVLDSVTAGRATGRSAG